MLRTRSVTFSCLLRRALLGTVAAAAPVLAWGQVTPPDTKVPASAPAAAPSQEPIKQPATAAGEPRKGAFQQTVIKQWHSEFSSLYTDSLLSLQSREKAKLSLTTTLFIGRRLWRGGSVVFNPEVSGGSGLSKSSGVAGALNGETFRVGSAEPVLYLARLYLQQRWALGPETS